MGHPVDVRGVLETLAAERVVTGQIDMGPVELGDQSYVFVDPVRYEITLTNTGAGIVAAGAAQATVRTACVRCLCDFEVSFAGEVEGFYVFPGKESGLPEEQDYEFISESMKVDLEPAVRQAVVVDLPFAPVHDPDCAGICPVCGADRNQAECACVPDRSDTPFARLKDLLEGDAGQGADS